MKYLYCTFFTFTSCHADGIGYSKIISALNEKGYKTKRGKPFGKNSLHEILRNEKYTGVFTYNKSAAKNHEGKANRHAYKDEDSIIKIDGAVPQIISKEVFETVQKKMAALKRATASFKAKEVYLLSGRIFCGECGAPLNGNSRKERPDHPKYVSYRCSRKNGKAKCGNKEIRKEDIESLVLNKLADYIFSDAIIPKISERFNKYIAERDKESLLIKEHINGRIKAVDKAISNIVDVIASTGSKALINKLTELENEKESLQEGLDNIDKELSKKVLGVKEIKKLFLRAKQLFKQGTLSANKKLVEMLVDKVVVHKDKIEICLNTSFSSDQPPNKARKDKNNPSGLCFYKEHLSDLMTIQEERNGIK